MNKPILALILILAISNLMIVESANAQTIPKPSVPEFTVRYVDYSYDVPPTYGIDQFTGKETIVKNGYHVENRSFEFIIRNQPFTPYVDSQGNNIHLFYNLRFKGHFGTEWMYFPFLDNGQGAGRSGASLFTFYNPDLAASDSAYTTLLESIPVLFNPPDNKLPSIGDEVDFQVQALTGYISSQGDGFYSLAGQSSSWSNTQTITILAPSTSPNPSPTIPELSWLGVIPLMVSILFIAITVRQRKTANISK